MTTYDLTTNDTTATFSYTFGICTSPEGQQTLCIDYARTTTSRRFTPTHTIILDANVDTETNDRLINAVLNNEEATNDTLQKYP